MNQDKNMESQQETIAQVMFQMDLMRMTAMADVHSGPRVMQQSVEETEVMRVMSELARVADPSTQR